MILPSEINKTIRDKMDRLRGSDVKAKSLRGSILLGIGAVLEKSLRFLRYVLLARLLIPQELGLMALIIAATLSFEAFTDVGIKQSIIQNKRGSQAEFVNVAWWFQCIRGLGLYCLGFLAVPWICRFYFQNRPEVLSIYSLPELNVLLRVAFLTILFNCLMSPRAHVLEKEFRFGKVVFLFQGGGVIGAIVTIVLAFVLRNVWALVIGFISESIFRCLLSYIICPLRPRLSIDRESFHDLFKFARGMFGLAILAYITLQTDVLVLSKMVPMEKVGLYAWALALAVIPQQFYRRIITPIILPAFSEKQDDNQFIRNGVVKIAAVVSMLCMPFIAFVFTCPDSILSVFYGPEFTEVSLPFVIFCITTVVRLQGPALVGVCFALNKPYVNRRYAIVRAIILVGLIYPSVLFFNLPGAALVVLLSNLISFAMQAHWVCKEVGLKFRAYVFAWISGMRFSIWILIVGLALRLFAGTSDIVNLIIVGSASIVVCLLNFIKLRPFRSVSQSHRQSPLVVGQGKVDAL